MEEVFHGAAFSKSPMNISYRRSVSAPYSLTTSSGLTTLPRDLDILTMGCSAISPYFSTRALRAPFSSPYSASRRLRSASGWFSKAWGFRPRIMPWEVRFWYGSLVGTTPMSYRNLCQKRLYSRCRVVCSMPPLYQSTGLQYSSASLLAMASWFFGSQ